MTEKNFRTTALAASFIGACTACLPLPASAQQSYDCVIEAFQQIELRSQVEGVIERVLVRRGDRVKAGQPLVVLESSAEQSAVELARYKAQMEGHAATSRNRVEYATKKLDRIQELQRQNYATPQAREEAEAEKRIAESEVRDATETQELARYELRHSTDLLARRTLRSPFNGVVVDRLLNPGDLAEAGAGRKPILKLAQVEPLRVEAVLPLAAFGRVRAGTLGVVVPEGIGGRHAAKVVVADSVFDSASGTFGVRLDLDNAGGALPAGIRCKVEFAGMSTPPAATAARP